VKARHGAAGSCSALRVAGLAAVAVAVVAVPVQAVYLAHVARTQLSERHEHNIRTLLVAAAGRLPDGATYAVTSAGRWPNAVYLLRHQELVRLALSGPTAAVQARLRTAGVRFVIVLYRDRPRAFSEPTATWYRVLVALRAGQLVEVTG
jgi:hypothetical protein